MIFLMIFLISLSLVTNAMEVDSVGDGVAVAAVEDDRPAAAGFDGSIEHLNQQIGYGCESCKVEKTDDVVYWSDIAKNFRAEVDGLVVEAAFGSLVDPSEYDEYQIKGVTEEERMAGSTVHDLDLGLGILRGKMDAFVKSNRDVVVAACVTTGLSKMTTTSKAVVNICPCGQQLHSSCAKAACHSDMTVCPNSFCNRVINTASLLKKLQSRSSRRKARGKYATSVETVHGAQVDAKTKVVDKKDVYDGDCAICLEPLRFGAEKK